MIGACRQKELTRDNLVLVEIAHFSFMYTLTQ
jgi:hypothetical protein